MVKLWGNFLTLFGKGAKEKQIPGWILSLPKNKPPKFLDGILLGDGYKGKHGSNKITLLILYCCYKCTITLV